MLQANNVMHLWWYPVLSITQYRSFIHRGWAPHSLGAGTVRINAVGSTIRTPLCNR